LRLAVDLLHERYIKDTQAAVLNFIFELLWTGMSSAVISVAFLGFRELKYREKTYFNVLYMTGILQICYSLQKNKDRQASQHIMT
jgi:hypothetical protein